MYSCVISSDPDPSILSHAGLYVHNPRQVYLAVHRLPAGSQPRGQGHIIITVMHRGQGHIAITVMHRGKGLQTGACMAQCT